MENQGPHAASIKKGWAKRYQMTVDYESITNSLEPQMVKDLAKLADGTPVRIHVSGDFHSAGYIHFWRHMAKRFPNLVFFGYTRSWRIPSLLPSLEASGINSIVVRWAQDRRTGTLPVH